MNLLIAWTWRGAMKPAGSAVHHPSLRLPLKICGLFDIGFAGGILDVTGMDSEAPAAWSGNPFSPGLDFADSALFDSLLCGNNDVSEELFNSLPPHLISSLNSLEENVMTNLSATDSLDAFLNLDTMLDQDMPIDEATDVNFLNADPSLDKMIYSLFGSESFSSKQTTLPDIYSLETAAKDVSSEPIIPSVFEKQVFDSLLMTSTYSPGLNPGRAVNLDYKKDVTFECVQKQGTRSGSKIRSNPLSLETNACSNNIDSYVKKAITKSQVVSKKEKRAGFIKSKEKRKSKVCDLEEEAEMLILKNGKLRQRITELEKMTKEMKAKLVASIAGKYPAYSLN